MVAPPFAERHIQWVLRYRWLVVLIALASAAGLGAGAPRLAFSNNFRVFFSAENPQLRAFEALEKIYTKNDFLLFVIQPPDGAVFSRATMVQLDRWTSLAWKLPFASRVDSLTNFQHTRADGDELIVDDLVVDAKQLTAEELEQIRRIAFAEPALLRRLISADGRTTGIHVRLYLPGRDNREAAQSTNAALALAEQMQREMPGARIEVTGTAMLSTAFAEAPRADARFLFPLVGVLLTAALAFFLRSLAGVVATLLLVVLSVTAALGSAGWLGFELDSASAMAPLIIMTLAIADAVHLLMTISASMRGGHDKRLALIECMRVNAKPILLTTLTTGIGFLGLNTSDAPPLRELGNITAIGIGLAWLYSMTFLPALVALLPLRVRADQTSRVMPRLAEIVIRRRRPLLAVGSCIAIVLSLQLLRLEINDRPVQYFERDNHFRRATELAVDSLTGFYGFSFSLPSGEPGGISDPDYLRTVDAFATWLRQQP
ncbi:MAG TPA: MMPL family transporter, partial [Terriglobales bacterium]|nr:MMPL family transporter [Terriglobales bacterium]